MRAAPPTSFCIAIAIGLIAVPRAAGADDASRSGPLGPIEERRLANGMEVVVQEDHRVPLVSMILLSQEINGLILAAILVFMMVLVNDRRIMGRHVNGTVINVISGATVALLIVLIALLLAFSIPGTPLTG